LKVINAKKHGGNWANYLRILDADAEGVDVKEIGEIIFPDLENDYPEKIRDQRTKDSIKAAKKLIVGGYRNIIPLPP
jgi:hypothetical protein